MSSPVPVGSSWSVTKTEPWDEMTARIGRWYYSSIRGLVVVVVVVLVVVVVVDVVDVVVDGAIVVDVVVDVVVVLVVVLALTMAEPNE